MLYLWVKTIHIISSTLLFGTGIGTASTFLYAHLTKNPTVIAAITRYVVIADWIFTVSSGIVQPLSGLLMVHLAGYSYKLVWVWGSIVGYILAGACWVPVAFLQIKMRNIANEAAKNNSPLPKKYSLYYKIWFSLGWPAFISLVIVFYLMTNKPHF